jgi:adenylate cyclase
MREKEGTLRAIHLLRQALDRDPSYGPALGAASICQMQLRVGGWSNDLEASRRQSVDLARRALRVAGGDPDVLACAAYSLGYFGEDIAAALALMDRALELNPSFADGWRWSGWIRLWAGQPDTWRTAGPQARSGY